MPTHTDHCGHDASEYVATFTYLESPSTSERYDLYVYDNPSWGQEVCLRYGSEGHEYCSPGRLVDFVMLAGRIPLYSKALEVLLKHGAVVWRRKAS